jgi:manganese/zinc/iron transport system permease protein
MTIDSTLQTVMLGTATLGAVAGVLGTFAVLRRQSLVGDAISHAALPGAVAVVLVAGMSPWAVVFGAILAGGLAMLSVGAIRRYSRLSFDAGLAIVLSSFFGLGLMLMSIAGKSTTGIERYLFGQAATLLPSDVQRIAILGGIAVACVLMFWKQFKLLSFDPVYAKCLGLPVVVLDVLMTGLVVLAVCIGLEAVGVVLMSALIVAPAIAARQWTNSLGKMTVLAGLFGAAAGVFGSLLSHTLSDPKTRLTVPTGPTIVLCAIAIVGLSFLPRLFAPRPGRSA